MTEVPEYINGSDTICHYTRFLGFWEPNCNCCRVGVSKMAELLHLFAENGLGGMMIAQASFDRAAQRIADASNQSTQPTRSVQPPDSVDFSTEAVTLLAARN